MKIQEFIEILKTKKSVLGLEDLESCGVYTKSTWYKTFQQEHDWPVIKLGSMHVVNRDDLISFLQPIADQFPTMDIKDTIKATSKRNCKRCSQPLSGVGNRKQFCSLPCLINIRTKKINDCIVPLNQGSITWNKQNMSLKQAAWMVQNNIDKIPSLALVGACKTKRCIVPDHQSAITKKEAAINRAASARAIYQARNKIVNPESLARITQFLEQAPAIIRDDLYESAYKVLMQNFTQALLQNDTQTATLIAAWLEENSLVDAQVPETHQQDSTFFPWSK